jgi:Family of unknown function (DUF6622)
MFVLLVVENTPIWVWLLLAFLIYRGIVALRPRAVDPRRALILPIVFLVWAIVGLIAQPQDLFAAWLSFAIALAAGAALGVGVANLSWPPTLARGSGLLHLPGAPTTLILACLGFAVKYVSSVAMALHPELRGDFWFCAFYGAQCGALAGIFWGWTIGQFARALQAEGEAASPARLVRLALFGAADRGVPAASVSADSR